MRTRSWQRKMSEFTDVIDTIQAEEPNWRRDKERIWGLPTGFSSLDYLLGGLQPAEIIVLGARTSHGKTSLATQLALHSAYALFLESMAGTEDVGRVILYSPEMTMQQLVMRMSSQLSEVDTRRLRQGIATEEERDKWIQALESLRMLSPYLEVYARSSVDIADMVSEVTMWHMTGPPVRLLIVDYLQRLTAGVSRSSYDRATVISLHLKDLANSLDIPLIVLSQLNREAADQGRGKQGDEDEKLPKITHIRDSGRIEEDADQVWLLWMKSRPSPDPSLTLEQDSGKIRPANLEIAKNRNGPKGRIPLFFNDRIQRFSDGELSILENDEYGK